MWTVTDRAQAALAAASEDRLAEVALPWSETEEFWCHGDPEDRTDLLKTLAGLAKRAQDRGQRIYC